MTNEIMTNEILTNEIMTFAYAIGYGRGITDGSADARKSQKRKKQ